MTDNIPGNKKNDQLDPLIQNLEAALAAKKKSTGGGPRTTAGKQRASMNAFKHGLTGCHLMLQPHELDSYDRTSKGFQEQYQPKTEMESQLVQRMIDCVARLNRISALENNFFSVATLNSCTDAPHDDAVEVMIAQTRAWMDNANNFEKLGRYESRIARQFRDYTRELERIQKERIANEAAEAFTEQLTQRCEESGLGHRLGSFRRWQTEPLPEDPFPVEEGDSIAVFPVNDSPANGVQPPSGV